MIHETSLKRISQIHSRERLAKDVGNKAAAMYSGAQDHNIE
jgi:hypothetical protein